LFALSELVLLLALSFIYVGGLRGLGSRSKASGCGGNRKLFVVVAVCLSFLTPAAARWLEENLDISQVLPQWPERS